MPTTKEFRCMPPGTGGILRYADKLKPFRVTGCETTLGITFKVDPKRAFCANMELKGEYHALSDEQGKKLRLQVWDRLVKFYETEELVVNNEVFGLSLVWTCQKVVLNEGGQVRKLPAWYMIQGIADFFKHCALVLKEAMQRMEGITGLDRLLTVPTEKQNQFDQLYAAMARRVEFFYSRFDRTKMEKKALGFVHDDTVFGRGLLLIEDVNGCSQIIDNGEAASCMYVPREVNMEQQDWSFSI